MPRLTGSAGSRSPAVTARLTEYAETVLHSGGRGLRREELRRMLEQPEMTAALGALEALMLRLAEPASAIESVVELWRPPDFGTLLAPLPDAQLSSAPAPPPVQPEAGAAPAPPAAVAAAVVPAEPALPAPACPPVAADVVATMPLPKMNLRLPNAKSGEPYAHRIDTSKAEALKHLRIAEVLELDGSGLQFDPVTASLHGTPLAGLRSPETLSLAVRLEPREPAGGDRVSPYNVRLELMVNADPRALWNQIEPDPALPFAKPHQRCQALPVPGLRVVAASVRGRSHAHSGTFREDEFFLGPDASGAWTIIAVSDGAGSARLSRRGSQLACQVSSASLQDSIAKFDAVLDTHFPAHTAAEMHANADLMLSLRTGFREPLGYAAFSAVKAIRAEAQTLGADEKDFSATLLLAAVRPHGPGLFVASFWIGDGALALLDPRSPAVNLLGDVDSGEYSGQTRFLLSSEFPAADPWTPIGRRVRCAWAPRGSILALMSDGVSDPKFGTDNALRSAQRWQAWWDELAQEVNLAHDNAALPQELMRYLDFWSPGEHDDRTLALVYPAADPAGAP